MKKLFYVLFVSIASSAVYTAAAQEGKTEGGYMTLSGQIEGAERGSIFINQGVSIMIINNRFASSRAIPLDSIGRFEEKLYITTQKIKPVKHDYDDILSGEINLREIIRPITYAMYKGKGFHLRLAPGEDLELTADAGSFVESLKFKGQGATAVIDNYLAQYARLAKKQEEGVLSFYLQAKDWKGFERDKANDTLRLVYEKLPEDGVTKGRYQVKLENAGEALSARFRQQQKQFSNLLYAIHQVRLDLLENYPDLSDDFIKKERFKLRADTTRYKYKREENLNSLFGAGAGIAMAALPDRLSEGNSAPRVAAFENYKGGTTSLSDFKGKHVYIDVWATWCGPCIREIPHMKKLEKDYHDKNIVFVSISTDKESARSKWKSMIDKKQMGGVQLRAKSSDFGEKYAINAIPRFILIDPQGRIVQADAPRPSSKEIRTLFDELDI